MSEKSGWAVERIDVPIEPGAVDVLLDPWRDGRAVSAAVFLRGGLMNRNYRVRVGNDDVVLRFYDRDWRACAKEAMLLRALRGVVPVPEMLYAVPEASPVAFAVMEYVDGISLRTLKEAGDADALSDVAREMGHHVATFSRASGVDDTLLAVHSIDAELLRGPNATARLIDHFLASHTVQQRLGVESARRVSDFAWRQGPLFTAHAGPSGLAHGDLNSANVLVRRHAGRWSVAAILDWEFAFAGSIFHDVGNFLRYERPTRPRFEPAFSQGLRESGATLPEEWLTIARLADLPALCDLLTRSSMPPDVVAEIRGLIEATIDMQYQPLEK